MHRGAVSQDHVLRAALQAHRTCELEEITQLHVHGSAGAHQLTSFAGHVEGDGLASACHHLEVFFARGEVDHFGVGIQTAAHTADQVDVHRQIARSQGDIGYAHKRHTASRGFECGPLHAICRFGIASQHQAKAHFAHGHAHGIGVGFGFAEHAVAVGVLPIRAIHTRKGAQVLPTKTQCFDIELGAVSQGHSAGGLFKAQVARHCEEAVDFHLQIARCTHEGALAALEVQRQELVGRAVGQLAAGGNGHGRGVVHHRTIAAHVDFELQIFGTNIDQRQAHFGGRCGIGRQAQPTAWCAVAF